MPSSDTDAEPRKGAAATGDLTARIADAARRAGGLLPPSGQALEDGFEAARSAIDGALSELTERLRAPGARRGAKLGELADLVIECHALKDALEHETVERRLGLLRNVQQGLSHLRGVGSLTRLLEKASQELGETVGFDRVIISRVVDSYLIAECVWYRDHPEDASQLLRAWQNSPPELTYLVLETELVRRRSAALVTDPINDPRTYKPLMQATATTSYVAAPIAPEGRVIGFVHADHLYKGIAVDMLDRDALWTFTEGLGYAIERTVLTERLRAQRDRVRQMVVSVEALTSELFAADVDMVEGGQEAHEIGHAAVSMVIAPESRIRALLTPRELEVLGLMAEGSTNRDIANRLVISEGTVKSHVKHILRKLRAANRAEAVSRFMRLSQAGGGPQA